MLSQVQCLGNFFRQAGHARHNETGMNRPDLFVSQFDASLEHTGLVGSVFVVEFASFPERFGKNFLVQTIISVQSRTKFRGIKDDLSVFLLVDRQNYGTIFAWGWRRCCLWSYHSPPCSAKNKAIMALFSFMPRPIFASSPNSTATQNGGMKTFYHFFIVAVRSFHVTF